MSFVSFAFLLLFIVSYLLCRALKTQGQRHIILLIASYAFYGYWDARFLLLLIFQTYVSYYMALKIESARDKKHAKAFVTVGVSISLLILGIFKYLNFFIESASRLFGAKSFSALGIILPVGISFYTFQALSYLIDVYRGKLKARNSFVKISLYIAFFPQLVAGPIVRAETFLPQLDSERAMTRDGFFEGLQIFLFGLFKKIVIADRLAVCVDAVFAAPNSYSGLSTALAVIAYSIQIYCDFSGYSDMAIGVAKAFGYELCPNFNMPYISRNPTEFWKRWHISLSQWLQDYLYISLGGNRKGKLRTYLNLMLTMLLGGLWHSAQWTFVAWGALNGAGLVVHKLWMGIRKKHNIPSASGVLGGGVTAISIAANYFFVCIGWVLFRSRTIPEALSILGRIFTNAEGVRYYYVFTPVFAAIILAASLVGALRGNGNGYYPVSDIKTFRGQFITAFVCFLILVFFYAGSTAFIYFQF